MTFLVLGIIEVWCRYLSFPSEFPCYLLVPVHIFFQSYFFLSLFIFREYFIHVFSSSEFSSKYALIPPGLLVLFLFELSK